MRAKITILALATFCFAGAQEAEVTTELNSAKDMQFVRGDMFVEGGISFSTQESTDSFSINPKFGYFLSDKLAVGGDVDFAQSSEDLNDAEYSSFGIGAFARYYFFEADARRFKSYGDIGLGYSHAREEYNVVGSPDRYDNTINGIKANISIGLNYFLTSHLAATFTLADILTYNNAQPENGSSSNSFELNINLFNNIFAQPKFGLLYKF
jgi:hypothetical protein